MSSDEESRNHLQRVASKIQVQDFQALVLPPVPVARGPNAHHQQQQQQQTHSHPHSHSHSPDINRRPVTSTSRGQHSSEPYPKPSNKGGVRGRVTVVCAECKRLKLRCSRDRPCTSCIKRACVDRCRYRNDEQPHPPLPAGEHRSIIPSTNSGDNVHRLVSTNCVQCSNANIKCDRREPCSQCFKQQVDCHYPGLQPLTPPTDPSILHHALARLARLEARLGEINAPECDQCLELHLKCDGNARNPCSWCLKRHSGGAIAGIQEAGMNLPPIQQQHGGPVCTYSSYAEQAQRQGLHSPQSQSSLHANSASASRDRSPYALRISSPAPPSSSHSNTSAGTELLARIQTAENVTNNYARAHNHSFSHGHSLSHGSATSMASGNYGPAYANASSTLTPITPSHPSSLHHYVTSPGTGGHGHQHSHSHSHSHSNSLPHHPYAQPDAHHQRNSSKHSPPQHLLPPQEQLSYQQQDHRQETHRPRGPSMSNSSIQLPRPQGSTAPTGFGPNNSSRHSKMPTPPGSSSSSGAPQSAATKLPEISNILTLLSPAPASSNSDKQSPLPFPTPVSGVVGSGLGNLSLGGGSIIQHLQSDIRGSSSPSRHTYSEESRRGSLSDRRGELPSPSRSRSRSTTPPHPSSGSRPSSSEAYKSVMVDAISKDELHLPRRTSGASLEVSSLNSRANYDEKHAQHSHSRISSAIQSSKREEDDDEMAEVDEIENDMDT